MNDDRFVNEMDKYIFSINTVQRVEHFYQDRHIYTQYDKMILLS